MYITFGKEWEDSLTTLSNKSELLEEFLEKKSQYNYRSGNIEVAYSLFSKGNLDDLYSVAKGKNDRSVMMQISQYLKLISSDEASVKNIKVFAAALREWLEKDSINLWIFKTVEGWQLPYLISKIDYQEADKSRDEPASVSVTLSADSIKYFKSQNLYFRSEDVLNKSISQIMAERGVLHETQDLIDDYMETQERFLELRKIPYREFVCNGKVMSGKYHEDDFVCNDTHCVFDEIGSDRSFKFFMDCLFWGKVLSLPVHPFMQLYSLKHYVYINAHVNDLELYEYNEDLADKLILPREHLNLLDILTENFDVLCGDIIDGKSSGTTILCKGSPGVGKTLTAEVYSEITHRPLLKINSGQLGITHDSVEKNLEDFLKKAERWNAVMLIDEADTFIRKRDNDLQQNAVVSAFLRTLEYFNGLLFMTTNRVDDVDDAIESRCIASISYKLPVREDAKKIWQVMLKEFNLRVDSQVLEALLDIFPRLSGRDIRELVKLVKRYQGEKTAPADVETFLSCASFRSVYVNTKKLEEYTLEREEKRRRVHSYDLFGGLDFL